MNDSAVGSITPAGYRPRIVDAQIARYQRIFGAIEIAGRGLPERMHPASHTWIEATIWLSPKQTRR